MAIVRKPPRPFARRLKWAVRVTAGASVLSLLRLMWLYCSHRAAVVDYTAVGELLLVLVIGLEGEVAISAFALDQSGARAAANNAVYDLYKTYLSIEYHHSVRRPAWFALEKAMGDRVYRGKILAGLAMQSSGEEIRDAFERKRQGSAPDAGDAECFAFDDEYHRVQDILGFFSMLSALSRGADREIVRTCDFFYDRWRVHLHEIVNQLKDYEPNDQAVKQLMLRRWKIHRATLVRLDEVFAPDDAN
jgi:hypothetical protein